MVKEPSEMTDDELKEVVDTGTAPELPDTPEEEKPEESAEAETPEEPEQPEEEAQEPEGEEEAPKPPSRRETLRIQQLLKKYGPPPERPTAPSQRQEPLNYAEALEADPEVVRQLEADRQATAQAQYIQGQNEGIKRAEYLNWNTSLKIDAPQVEKKYPVLDPESPEFHPAVADAVNNWYLNMSGFDPQSQTIANPNIGYGEFVEGFMELVKETASEKTAQATKNIAKQAATTGLRPDGSSAKRLNLNQAPEKMTMEELYAAIGQTPPKK